MMPISHGINTINNSPNGIYQNPNAKDKNLEIDQSFTWHICQDHWICWGEGGMVFVPMKTASHHSEHCVTGTES